MVINHLVTGMNLQVPGIQDKLQQDPRLTDPSTWVSNSSIAT